MPVYRIESPVLLITCCIFGILPLAACDNDASWNTVELLQPDAMHVAARSEAKRGRAHPAAPMERIPYGQDGAEYELTFSEEFDDYDSRIWNDHIWYEAPNRTRNYAVENGLLKIWPERDASGNFFNRTIDTDGKFSQTYGYFEMEAKLPRGKGTWPAFWLFAHHGKRRPEIDIMEAYAGGAPPWGFKDGDGVVRPRAYGVTVWHDKGHEAGRRQYDTRSDLSARFHKYAMKWEPNRQTFYFDGKTIMTIDVSMSEPMYLLLDLWFGSDSGKPDDSTPQGKANAYQVNYVRAWQFRLVPRKEE
ncbi:MAG TPA: glycoside hydrolase family 16 protein [Paucimonas sp.]|nr:glycoside hydrolase family 16 protein [Paucimonas sp.]HJW57325.1 glycoside hydrolase family 16 protein [Burkholderiaceae bacterium]